jgi:DNA-directed RNA polymerase specialized sigma24 family protein
MLTALYKSHVLDGICRRLAKDWSEIAFEDVELLVAEAVDVLYEKVRGGEKIRRIAPFLVKVASRKAYDFHESRRVIDALDPADVEAAAGKESRRDFEREEKQAKPKTPDPGDELDYEDKRRIALRIARGLLPRLGQQRIQDVMSYIFDAIEAGHDDISNEEIEDALGLSPDTVRTSKSRGFTRLARIAKEEKLLAQDFDLLGLDADAEESE